MRDYETQVNQADIYDSYDSNPYEPAFTKPAYSVSEQQARLMTDKKLAEEIVWIKKQKTTNQEVCDFLSDELCDLEMSTAMVRQVLEAMQIEPNDSLKRDIEAAEEAGF